MADLQVSRFSSILSIVDLLFASDKSHSANVDDAVLISSEVPSGGNPQNVALVRTQRKYPVCARGGPCVKQAQSAPETGHMM
jgi:hypothetical protein